MPFSLDRAKRGGFLPAAIIVALLVSAIPANAAEEPVVITIEAPETTKVGDSFEVQVVAEASEELYAYQFALDFDPDIVQYQADTADLPDGGFDDVNTGDNQLEVSHTRLGTSPGLTGKVILFTGQFKSLAAGTGSFSISGLQTLGSGSEAIEAGIPLAASVVVTASGGGDGSSGTPVASQSSDPTTTQSAIDKSEQSNDQKLAKTGSTAVIVIAIAGILLALGLWFVMARRNKEQ